MIAFLVEHYPGIQIVLLNLLNLFSMIYLGYFSPFKTKFRNRLEIFNEVTVLMSSFYMMCFTDLVGTLEAQSTMGWVMIVTIVLNSLINISIVLYVGGKGLYLIFVKYYRLVKHKLCGSPQVPKSLLLRTPEMALNA